MISIIIPTRNEEKYIEKTISQFIPFIEKFNLEIIISDGNSADSTVGIANRFPVKVIKADEDSLPNIAKGRNLGASNAHNNILMHIDADVIIPELDIFFTSIIETFKDDKVVALTTPLWVYPEEEKFKDIIFHYLINKAIYISFYFGSFLAKGECQIIKRYAFNYINGYNSDIIVGEDCNLFYRLNKIGKILYLSKLKIFHSPRRFRNDGYIKLFLQYFREGIFLLFFKKSYLDEWKPER